VWVLVLVTAVTAVLRLPVERLLLVVVRLTQPLRTTLPLRKRLGRQTVVVAQRQETARRQVLN
jgi:hypothetical protein